LSEGDLLILASDVASFGMIDEIEDFVDWFANQPFKY